MFTAVHAHRHCERDRRRDEVRDLRIEAERIDGKPSRKAALQADRERFAQYAAAALGSMIGFRSNDSDKGQRAILAKAIETLASLPGALISVPALRDVIENQDDALLNAIGGGYPDKCYANLAQRLLTLELNNKQLLTGDEQLDIDALLGTGTHARPGRVRLSEYRKQPRGPKKPKPKKASGYKKKHLSTAKVLKNQRMKQ